jgi:hypothetical protein
MPAKVASTSTSGSRHPTGGRTRSPWPPRGPNVRYIVLDDVGFGAMEPYGGPIQTRNFGTIKRVAVDVSGQPFVDLAREAVAAFACQ